MSELNAMVGHKIEIVGYWYVQSIEGRGTRFFQIGLNVRS
jgi:hypothetical protein